MFERFLSKTFIESLLALRVSDVNTSGSFLNGISFDEILPTYPTTSSELYSYKLAGVLQKEILVTYTDASKSVLFSVVAV